MRAFKGYLHLTTKLRRAVSSNIVRPNLNQSYLCVACRTMSHDVARRCATKKSLIVVNRPVGTTKQFVGRIFVVRVVEEGGKLWYPISAL
jgi:Mg-chelatase subunit ChlI